MGEQHQDHRPALKVLKGGGQREERALRRLLGWRHLWLVQVGAVLGVLAAGTFLLMPAFDRRAPQVTPEEVAAAATEGHAALVNGLVEVLELDKSQAAHLRRTLDRYDARAREPRHALEAALAVLRGAAAGAEAEAPAVDLALRQRRDAQARLEALDAELVEAVSAGLTPSQKARAAIVLGHYLQRGGADGHGHLPPAPGPAPTAPPKATTAPAARP